MAKKRGKTKIGRPAKAPKVRSSAAGKKRGRPKKEQPELVRTVHTRDKAKIAKFKPNGSGQAPAVGEDLRLQLEPLRSLGPIELPSPEDSLRVLKELAELNDKALAAKARYDSLKDATKQAKEKYDELAEMVLTRLRVTTHKSDLPLFDAVQREQDQAKMEQAGQEQAQDTSQDASGEPTGHDQAPEGAEPPSPLPLGLEAPQTAFNEVTGTFQPIADDPPF